MSGDEPKTRQGKELSLLSLAGTDGLLDDFQQSTPWQNPFADVGLYFESPPQTSFRLPPSYANLFAHSGTSKEHGTGGEVDPIILDPFIAEVEGTGVVTLPSLSAPLPCKTVENDQDATSKVLDTALMSNVTTVPEKASIGQSTNQEHVDHPTTQHEGFVSTEHAEKRRQNTPRKRHRKQTQDVPGIDRDLLARNLPADETVSRYEALMGSPNAEVEADEYDRVKKLVTDEAFKLKVRQRAQLKKEIAPDSDTKDVNDPRNASRIEAKLSRYCKDYYIAALETQMKVFVHEKMVLMRALQKDRSISQVKISNSATEHAPKRART